MSQTWSGYKGLHPERANRWNRAREFLGFCGAVSVYRFLPWSWCVFDDLVDGVTKYLDQGNGAAALGSVPFLFGRQVRRVAHTARSGVHPRGQGCEVAARLRPGHSGSRSRLRTRPT
jgi:hypothetical protein